MRAHGIGVRPRLATYAMQDQFGNRGAWYAPPFGLCVLGLTMPLAP